MNLRNRALLTLGLTFFAFFILIAAVMLSVTLSGLDRIEREEMLRSVNQTESALHAESSSLLSTTQDWAWWDETDQFVRNENPGYLEENTGLDSLATLHLNLFMILDGDGNIIFGRTLPPDLRSEEPVPEDLAAVIRNTSSLVSHAADDPGTSGILLAPGGPYVITSVPILPSNRSGPAHGSLVMGRYLVHDPLRRINEMTGFDVGIIQPDHERSGRVLPAEVRALPENENLALVAENDSWMSGYTQISDVSGRGMILMVTQERQLYRTGFANILTYLFLLFLWAVMTGLIVLIVMDRVVLRRMGLLADHVRSLSGRSEEVPAPVLSGNDELAELENTIISSRRDLLVREEQLRAFVNAMPGPAALFSRKGTVLLSNPVFAEIRGEQMDTIVGSGTVSSVPRRIFSPDDRFITEALQKKEAVHFETEWQGKTYLVSSYPVLGDDGEVIQLGLLAFDISERKRLENALQKVMRKIALLNTVIFSDIQNKVFVQTGYVDIARHLSADPKLKQYLDKEADVIREIQDSLRFAKQYNDMGASPPRWQNVQDVMLFAISHLDLGSLQRDFQLGGLEIFADSLLERVLVTLVENAILHATGATLIRAGYTIAGDDAVIVFEDNGPGIPGDRKESLFEKGTGTGGSGSLFLSREILSITGITITENGVPGKGARFEIRVPKGSFRLNRK